MQTYMVLAPAVAPLLEYDPDGTLFSVTTQPFKELEMFFEGLMKKLSYFQTQNPFAKIKRKWHRPPTGHSGETPGRPKGEAAKQRAPEPPVFTHLSLARASMKIWCIIKNDTAIKWRELLVVDEPCPLACVAHSILGETPVNCLA
jgi:hypothetical protein